MDARQRKNICVETVFADRHLVDQLEAHRLISGEARQYALDLLYPARMWGVWIARLLTVTGTSLVLAGVVYFFAFNWRQISPALKLGSIQVGILACLGASFYYGVHARFSGRILLLSASLLVGVFLAVFGQIYQTGADADNLFMMWSLLILPWALISQFAALWAFWLVVTNTAFILWWNQAALPSHEMEFMIFSYLALLNGFFLGLRDYFAARRVDWLESRWTRIVLVLSVLISMLIPSIALIIKPDEATRSIIIGSVLSAFIHSSLYLIYRFKLREMWSLSATVLSMCLLFEVSLFKVMSEVFRPGDSSMFLLMGAATIAVFTYVVARMRVIAKELGESHV